MINRKKGNYENACLLLLFPTVRSIAPTDPLRRKLMSDGKLC